MMVEKEDLGLSLSLGFPHEIKRRTIIPTGSYGNNPVLQLNLMPSSSSPSPAPFGHHLLLLQQKTSWTTTHEIFPPSSSSPDREMEEGCRVESRTFLKGIDVNRLPAATADAEEDGGVSSPNSTISSISGKRSEREDNNNNNNMNNNNNNNNICDENEMERTSSRGNSDEEDGDTSRKKLRLSKDQSAILEESFKEHNTLNPKQKLALAKRLGLRPRQVEVWFQNRRARTKLKQTEVDCEYLKRCCEGLTEENRRLQKEVQELRALKLSPQFYMQMTPPTTLTMCPSCERVAVPPSSSSTTSSTAPPNSNSASVDHHHHHRSHHQIVSGHPPRSTGGFNLNHPWVAAAAAATTATTPVLPTHHRPFDALHSRS